MKFDLGAFHTWCLSKEARALSLEAFLPALGRRLNDAGIPVWRGHLGNRTKHPEVFVRFYNWYAGDEIASCETMPHAVESTSMVTKSPAAHLIATHGTRLRVPLEVDRSAIAFPTCQKIRDAGGTDYLAMRLSYYPGTHNLVSWATKRPGGFTDAELVILESLNPAIAVRMEVEAHVHTTRALLQTYLGRNAAARVLAGQFKRGTGQTVDAVIWMSDLRSFTSRVDQNPLPTVLDDLNTYFTCVADPIVEHGGEILKFIGDAVLGIFPLDDDPRGAGRRALDAAETAFARIAKANEDRAQGGRDALRFGVVLHKGEVMYGNIGATGRLDFTVIGKAVNEAARVESLCKTLHASLLLTRSFVKTADDERAVSLGEHELRGVSHPVEVFTHRQFTGDA